MSTIIGTPTALHDRKSTDLPNTSGRFMYPNATTLVAVPIGVAIPPTLAPHAVMSNSAVAYGDSANPGPRPAARTVMIPTVTGHIMAVAAALLIHIEMSVTDNPTAARSEPGDRPAQRVQSKASAIRRSSP